MSEISLLTLPEKQRKKKRREKNLDLSYILVENNIKWVSKKMYEKKWIFESASTLLKAFTQSKFRTAIKISRKKKKKKELTYSTFSEYNSVLFHVHSTYLVKNSQAFNYLQQDKKWNQNYLLQYTFCEEYLPEQRLKLTYDDGAD